MLPVILSAPHGGDLPLPDVVLRRGIGVADFAAARDAGTGEIAERVAFHLERKLGARPFLIVARFHRKYLDVNRPRDGAYESAAAGRYYDEYHGALARMVRTVGQSWGRGVLLDIHGQAAEKRTIFRGTLDGKTVRGLLERFGRAALSGPASIFGHLETLGYRVSPPGGSPALERRYRGGFIVQTYGSHRRDGIDAFQLELGSALRIRSVLERTATDLAEAIAAFAKEFLPLAGLREEIRPFAQP